MPRFLTVHRAAVLAVAAGLSLPVGLLTSQAATAATTLVPSSIDGTGSSDVTSALNSFFATVPDGSTIDFPNARRYRIEGVLYFPRRNNLTIDGHGSTFFATTNGSQQVAPTTAYMNLKHLWPRHRAHWLFEGGSNIVLRRIVVKGPNLNAGPTNSAYIEALEAQHGVEFANVAGATLSGSTISHTYGDLVSVTYNSTNVKVLSNVLTHAGRQGVTVDKGQNVLIDRNTISDIGRSAIDLEPVGGKVSDVTVSNNLVGKANGVFIAAQGLGDVSNITISKNTLTGEPINIVVKSDGNVRRHTWTVMDNTSDTTFGSPTSALRFLGVDGVVVTGNTQRIAPHRLSGSGEVIYSGMGVAIFQTCDATVGPGQFPGATTVLFTDNYTVC